ncbi:MAG: WG repeat-containing protein [Bacteroidota bacterium]
MSVRWYWLGLVMGLVAIGSIQAQERVVYPVKKDHLWGFISKGGDMLVPPRYDAIGEKVEFAVTPNTGEPQLGTSYRMVELNGKLGVIDQNLRAILPCDNDFILPVSVDQFMVRQEEGYAILDSTGRNLSGLYYHHLEFAGATKDGEYYYTIFNEGKKGIINAQGDTLLPCKFAEIRPLNWRNSPFLIRRRVQDKFYTLVAEGGRNVLTKVADAKSPHPELLLVLEAESMAQKYRCFTPQGKLFPGMSSVAFATGGYLSPNLVSLGYYDTAKDNEKVYMLFQMNEQRLLRHEFAGFRTIDEQYCAGLMSRTDPISGRDFTVETLINPQGGIVDSSNWYARLEVWPGRPGYFRARGFGGWGLIDIIGQEVVPTEYDSIGWLDDGLALVVRKGALGMIAVDGRVIVPAEYSQIRRSDNMLTLEKGTSTFEMDLTDQFELEEMREYQKLRTISVEIPDRLRIAEREDFKSLYKSAEADTTGTAARNARLEEIERLNKLRLARWFESINPIGSFETKYIPTDNFRALDLAPTFLSNHSNPFLVPKYFIRFYSNQAVQPSASFRRLVVGGRICIRPQRLFIDSIGKLAPNSVLGLRVFDYRKQGWRYAAAVDENAEFYLLGGDAKPLRDRAGAVMKFSFVGRARNGLMRACIGGKLVASEEIPDEPLPSMNGLMQDFQLAQVDSCGTLSRSNNSLEMHSVPGNPARWGLLDTLGRWVVPPVYDYLEENINGQMVARIGHHYGVIDAQGDTIVPFKYVKIRFYNGFWRVNTKPIGKVYFNWRGYQILDIGADSISFFQDGYSSRRADDRWGYIDELGEPLEGGGYTRAKPFGEGLAAVKLDSTQWAFVDTSGHIKRRLSTESIHDLGYFSGGYCWFRSGSKFGFLDTSFQVAISARYRRVSNFVRGRSIIRIGPGVAVIDTSGNFVVEPGQYRNFTRWNEAGVAVATKPDGKMHLVDIDGNHLSEPFDTITLRGGPLYPVKLGRSWGYINRQGKRATGLNYTRAEPFVNDRARVRSHLTGERWLFINLNGDRINRKSYELAEDFSNGVAYVKNQQGESLLVLYNGGEREIPNCEEMFVDGPLLGCNDSFFADHDGNSVFLNTYDKIQPFGSGEIAFVRDGRRWGMIDRRGMLLVSCKYYKVERRPDGLYKAYPPAFGIYNTSGKMVVPAVYDELVLLEKGLFRVERGEKVGYLKVNGDEVWPLQN